MNRLKINLVYFSPTCSTKKVTELLSGVWENDKTEIDITEYKNSEKTYCFSKEDLVYIGVPSYGGRVPAAASVRLDQMKGNNTPVVLIVSFGNRAYDDTLLELKNIVQKNGFCVVAAVAAVTEHSIMHQFGAGRPDKEDKNELLEFAYRIQEKIQSATECKDKAELLLSGSEVYRDYHNSTLKPEVNKKCTNCGICEKQCPVGAISMDSAEKTDVNICISCMRCLAVCPRHARTVSEQILSATIEKLKNACESRKSNEIYL